MRGHAVFLALVCPVLALALRPDGKTRLNLSAHVEAAGRAFISSRASPEREKQEKGRRQPVFTPSAAKSTAQLQLTEGSAALTTHEQEHPLIVPHAAHINFGMRPLLQPLVFAAKKIAAYSSEVVDRVAASHKGGLSWMKITKTKEAPPDVVFGCCFSIICLGATLQAFTGMSPVKLGLCSALLFGISHFMIAYSVVLFANPQRYLATKFTMAGFIMMLVHSVFSRVNLKYRHDVWKSQNLKPAVWVSAAASGLAIGVAQKVAALVYSADRQSAGPNSAVMSCEVFFVVLFFRVYLQERLSWSQVFGASLTFLGLVILSGKLSEDHEGHAARSAYLLSFLATFIYAIDSICLRIAAVGRLPVWPMLCARTSTLGLLGACCLCFAWDGKDDFLGMRMHDLRWPFLNAVSDCLGMYCGIRAFESLDVKTGVISATFNCNCVIVLLLNSCLRGYVPSFHKGLGVLVLLAGCSTLALAPSQSEATCDYDTASDACH